MISSLFYISPFISNPVPLLNMEGTAYSQANSQRIFMTSQTPIHSYLKAKTDSEMEWSEMLQNTRQKQIKERMECGIPWSMFLWAKMHLLQCYQWLQLHNWEWETLKASVTTSPPLPLLSKKQSSGKLLKRVLQNCDKDAKVWLFTIGGFWWSWGGRSTQLSLRGWSLPVWPCSSEHMETEISVFIFGGGVWQGGKVYPGGKGNHCDQGKLYGILK